jgi:transcriptional regulator with AAA-type ATPase domain/tetratricopeptide (TPR) repeat protein
MVPLATLLGGQSPGMIALREKVLRLVDRQSGNRRLPPVFIHGETGTGKTELARSLHDASPRRNGPFVDVNSSAVSETLAVTEMFGHERGAFTGAHEARKGLFEQAHGGTLFLDEIALMSMELQAKLLKVIEDKTIRRVGGARSQAVDVWVITASNEDLLAAIRERRFRKDLYFRLARVKLQLPPLRERGDDVVELAQRFLDHHCREYDLPPRRLDDEARGALLAYSWPGNVRELGDVMEGAALFSDTEVITPRVLEQSLIEQAMPEERRSHVQPEPTHDDRERLIEVYKEEKGNLSRAAARLDLPRNTLRHRLKRLGVLQGTAGRSPAAHPTPTHPRETPPEAGRTSELRRLALLRVELSLRPSGSSTPAANWITETAVSKVEAFGGRVLERSDSSLTAIFGLERGGDAPGRAAYTALALQRAAERAGADGQSVQVSLVVDVRRCLVEHGSGGAVLDPSARSEAWARLAPLQACAGPQMVVASETALPFLRHFELSLLDAPAGVGSRIYQLVGHGRGGLGLRRRVSAFVGRQHELGILKDHLETVTRGQGRAVGIVGEVGIGKSRLISEFRRSLADQDVTYLEGACFSYTDAVPYVPVLTLLRRTCGIGDSDSTETIIASLGRQLQSLDMDVDECIPYLLQLFALRAGTERLARQTAESIRNRTHDILSQMILLASEQRPLVVVVEDVHWADRASQEVFSKIVEGLPGARVLFVSTHRPGFRPSWMDRSFAVQIALPPLSHGDSRTMLRSVLVEDVAEPVERMILQKAEGNPFFLEELYRAVEGQGRSATTLAVPDTIEEVLLARIERLPEDAQSVLQTAAVLGRQFAWRLLEMVWRGSGSLQTHMALLTELEFLYQRGGREPVYVFTHSLTQEVTYASLTPARRRELHGAAGAALERLHAARLEEAYDRLAYHYSKTEEAAKAVEYLSGFAARAARGGAHEEAIRAWSEALQHVERLAPDVRDTRRLEVLLSLASSLLPLGRLAEVGTQLLPQRDRVEGLRNPALAARYYFVLARMYMLGNHPLVVDYAHWAIAEAERCGDSAMVGSALGVLAVSCVLSGEAEHGIDFGQRAVALLEKTENRWSLSYTYWALGLCAMQLGRFQQALDAEQRSLEIAREIGDAALEVSATWAMGIVRSALGDWDAGIADCRRAVQVAHDVLYRALATAFLSFAYTENGNGEDAIAALEESIPLVDRFGLRAYKGWFTAFQAEAYRLAGRLELAEKSAESAQRIAGDANFPVALGWAQLYSGRIAFGRHDHAAAVKRLEQALATFTKIKSRYECGRTHLDLAEVCWDRGDRDAARDHLAAAHTVFRDLHVDRYRAKVEDLAARWSVPLAPRDS